MRGKAAACEKRAALAVTGGSAFILSNWTAKNISGNAVTLGNATLLSSSRSYAPLKTAPTRQAVRNIT